MTVDSELGQAVESALGQNPFSGVVLVRSKGQVMLERCQGLARREDGAPIAIDTAFGTASGCKVFTAVAVLQLIERGAFALETPLRELLEIPYPLDPALQVRNLLLHNSGLPDYFDEEALSDQQCLELMTEHAPSLLSPRDYLRLFPNRPPKFPAGQRFNYNNGAFVLLAQIVEEQSALPFPDYVSRHVFAKAGMDDSGYFPMDALPPNAARGYMNEGDGQVRSNRHVLPIIGSGDGGAFVSAPDWARFWEALLSRRLLGDAITTAMLRPQIAVNAERRVHYGHGVWMLLRDGAVLAHYVEGQDFGVRMFSAVLPGHEVEVTILDNHGNGADRVWGAVRRVLLSE